MLEELIAECKRLLDRTNEHHVAGVDALPPERRLSLAELDAWYNGVRKILEDEFGSDSQDAKLWREGLAAINKQSWEALGRGESPRGVSWVAHDLAESLGILAQIRLQRLPARASPQLNLELTSLHPAVLDAARVAFTAGDYDSAVFAAFRAVEQAVRIRTGAAATDLGVTLVSNALNPKAPLLRLSNITAEQEAFHALFRDALGAFKNPLSHRPVKHSDPVRVLQYLAFASLLIRLVEGAPIVT